MTTIGELGGNLARDVRYSIRGLRRSPGFTAIAVLTIALGAGANTAMFSVLYGILLAPLPYADPDRLVDVSMMQTTGHKFDSGTSDLNLRDWIAEAKSFEGLGVHRPDYHVNLTGQGEAEEINAWKLSARSLALLGVPPLLGRWFVPEEDTASGPRSALISYPLWQRRFGGNASVVGQKIFIDGEPFTIAGVMPPRFEFPPLAGAWRPVLWLSLNLPVEMAADRGRRNLSVIGGLKSGVSIGQAQAEMDGIIGRLAKTYPKENGEWPAAKVSALSEGRGLTEFRSTLWLLSGAAGLVLLIACANVANLLIVRGAAREREFAIRRALGVSTGRLMGQLLTESCVLAILGCAVGVLLAYGSLPVLKALLDARPRVDEIAIRPAVLAFAAAVSLLTGIFFGISPALRAAAHQAARVYASRMGPSRQKLRKTLVAVEIALGLVLLSAAGLLIESYWRAMRVDLGFRPDHVLSMRFTLPRYRYDSGRRVEAFREELLGQVSALPGVVSVGANSAPPMGAMSQGTFFEIEGKPPSAAQEEHSAFFGNVSRDYFRAMGIAILRGRNFGAMDTAGSSRVAIVSQSVARKYFAGEEVLGKRIRLGRLDVPEWFTVIGVVGDVREDRPETPSEGAIYALSSQLPESQQGSNAARMIVLAVRTAGEPAALAKAVRTVVAGIDRDQPAGDVLTMRQIVDRKLAGRRLSALLVGLFATLALVLAAVGVFGVVAYSVSCRTNEIGIRMALGARRSNILAMVARDTFAFGVVGLVAGTLGAIASSRLLASMLYGVAPAAPGTLAASAVVLAVALLAAILIAARRAIALDPMIALRHE